MINSLSFSDNELDALQNKLQATLHAIHAERAKNYESGEKDLEIQNLLRQKGELTEIIRRMKARKMGIDPDEPVGVGRAIRKSFAAGRVSMSNRMSRGFSIRL